MDNITFEQLPQAVGKLIEKLDKIERLIQQGGINSTSENSDQLLTIEQAAEFLNLAVPTLYSKVSKREIPFMKRSKRLYFSTGELSEYLKAGRIQTNDEVLAEAHKHIIKRK